MKRNRFLIQVILMLSVVVCSLYSCDMFDARLRIVNATSQTIFIAPRFDSSYINVVSSVLERTKILSTNLSQPIKNLDICRFYSKDTCVVAFPKQIGFDEYKNGIWIYIFTDSLSSKLDTNDLKNRRIYTCLKYYTKNQLESTNWIVTIKDLKSDYQTIYLKKKK